MIKRAVIRGINSFVYGIASNVVVFTVMVLCSSKQDFVPVLPGFLSHFRSPLEAVLVEVTLIGVTSAVFGAGSVIMEMERMSLLQQSIIYFILTAAVWIPVGCYCWEIHKYPSAMLSVSLSYTASYIISWLIQYRTCKSNVEQINARLSELKQDDQKGR